ncbi:MAG: hypothetical protein LBP23_09795, partial [Treponema sp.]|nr:hypothetical protein [Treponema sp.]
DASYIITAVELRNSAGEVIKTWEGLALEKGDTWTGDLDLEGSFTLYCTVRKEDEQAAGRYEYGTVTIKLHEVTESQIIGESFFTDTDGDGFSDSWESYNDFDPADAADGDPVYVSASASEGGLGTEASPYKSLTMGLWKAKYGLTKEARTVMVVGNITRATEDIAAVTETPAGTTGDPARTTSLVYITDTGARGVTISGNPSAVIDAAEIPSAYTGQKRALYLGPGTKMTLKSITITNGSAIQAAGIHANGAALTLDEGVVIQKGLSASGASPGSGVLASNGASVLMKNGSLIGDDDLDDDVDKANKGWRGVGVSLFNKSSLTMEGGSRISGNKSLAGGAVNADLGCLVTLEDRAEISENIDNFDPSVQSIGQGGGVQLNRGSRLIMKGGLITGNILTKGGGGGGVYVGSESVFEMQGGKISGNKTNEITIKETASKGNGGGVYVDSGGAFNMSGGEIGGNTANGRGGGVYVNDGGSFFKTGGIIYGLGSYESNTANSGGAAYASPGKSTEDTLSGYF